MDLLIVLRAWLLIAFSSGQRIEHFSCDFEELISNSICNYTSDSDLFGWSIVEHQERESFEIDGPLRILPGSGHYLRYDRGARVAGQIESSNLDFKYSDYCLSLDYYIFNWRSELAIWTNNHFDHQLFFRNGKSSYVDRWQHYERTIEFRSSERGNHSFVRITAIGHIALDNLFFTAGRCQETTELTCDFDVPYKISMQNPTGCSWMNPTNLWVQDTLQYSFARGQHSRDQTAMDPRGRHMYVYKPVPFGVAPGYLPGELYFGEFHPEDGTRCLTFYHRNMFQMNWAIVEKSFDGQIVNFLKEFSNPSFLQHNKVTDWDYASTTIDPIVPIKIYMKLNGEHSMEMDSYKITHGKCPPPVNCDFRTDLCGWSQHYGEDGTPLMSDVFRIGSGRLLDISQDGYVNPIPHGHQFLYYDDSHYSRYRTKIYSEYVDSGTYCLHFDFTAVGGMRLTLQALLIGSWQELFMADVEADQWTRQFVDVKVMSVFKIQLDVQTQREVGNFQMKDLLFESGTCAQVLAIQSFNGTSNFPEVDFYCFQSGHRIPQYRSCDGVIDCPMGEDEGVNCVQHNCALGGIPCKRRKFHFCLTDRSQFCNGIQDCEDGADEDPRLCDSDLFCANYCLNNGRCWESEAEAFNCKCDDPFSGKRCHIEE